MSFNFIKEPKINGYGQSVFTFFEKGFRLNGKARPAYIDVILSGVSPLVLTNAISLNYLKLFGGTEQLAETYLDSVTLSGGAEQRNLPAGYTQVEYLEVETSGAYFPTGINATVNTDMGITASNVTAASAQLLVAQCVSGGDYFRIAKATATQRIIGTFASSNVTDNNTEGANKFTARINKSGFYVNGSLVGTFSNIPSSLTDVGEIDIFSGKYSENVYYAYIGSRFYSAWIDDNVFLPCRRNSDNKLGICNTKTGQFILPSGTGTFTAGADVTAPSPDTPMDIVCNNGVIKVIHNLIDLNVVTDGYYYDPQGVYSASPTSRLTGYIPIVAGQSVTVYFKSLAPNSNLNVRINIFNSNKVWQSQEVLALEPSADGTEIITPTVNGYIRVSGNYTGANVDWDTAKVVYGEYTVATIDSAIGTIYTDGTQEVVTDSLGNTASAERLLAVGDYKDTQEVLNGSVTRNVGIYVLDGTETWSKSSTYTGSFYSSSVNPPKGAKVANNPNVYCTHGFKVDNLNEYASAPIGAFYWYSTPTMNYKYDDGTATVEQFKQWLSDQYNAGTPVTIVYPLATATTETATGQSLSKSPVTQTAGSISNLPIAITESQKTVPTPQQPLQINCNNGVIKVSKNLWSNDITFTSGSLNVNTGQPATSTISHYTSVIPVKIGETYTFSLLDGAESGGAIQSYKRIMGYSSTNTTDFVQQVAFIDTTEREGQKVNVSFTIPTGVNYIRVSCGLIDSEYQLEQGATATSYMPYGQIYTDGTVETVEIDTTGDTATAEMLLKVGDYKDEQEVLTGSVTRNVGIKVLDGTENWTQVSGSSAPFALVVNDFVSKGLGDKVLVYSTHLQGVRATATWSNYENLISFTAGSSENRTFRVRYLSNTKTLAEFKQFLAEQYANGTPVICVYYKTATTETVTGQPLTVQTGTNTVTITQASIDGLEMEVSYKSGVRVTVTEIENAQLSNNVEVTIS